MTDAKKLFWLFLLFPGAALAVGGSFNSKEPIEITSDALQVEQQQNIAIFTGNVVAIQKDVRLKSDKMTVYYAPKSEGQKKENEQKQTIKKIDVEGNVFLENPEETASGARGDYDVEGELIHLYDNVVLTHGQNVLKGSELTYNFATGHSVVTGGAVAESGASKGKQRVRALFVPGNAKAPETKTPEPKKAP